MPIRISKILSCECLRCGHKWIPNKDARTVVVCAKCNSPRWNKKKKEKMVKNEIL